MATHPWSAHQKLSGQTALCHHWNPAGYIANFPRKRSRKMATACEKGGQEKQDVGHKDSGMCEVEAVGELAQGCSEPLCLVGGNQWLIFLHFAVGR